MEDIKLSLEAIDKEISFFKELISERLEQLEQTKSLVKGKTDRINILRAIECQLEEGPAKIIVQKTYQTEADSRFELAPKILNHEANIKHFTKIIEKLEELKETI